MSTGMIKLTARHYLQRQMNRRQSPLPKADLPASAIIFAPHPDDETLGCGGTIIGKVQAGADLRIVFVTDGRRSHKRLMAEPQLRQIRAKEARLASITLGVSAANLIFLDIPEGQLLQYQPAAIEKIERLLKRYRPAQLFVPHHQEPPPDHRLTHRIVLAALARYHQPLTVFEYPVWLWRHWPWTNLNLKAYRHPLAAIKHNVVLLRHLLGDCRHHYFVGPHLVQKRAALNQHQSQINRLLPDLGWQTLADVAEGDFLACLLQDYEYFYRYTLADKVEQS